MGHFETYKDENGEHRWRFVYPNGRNTANGSEGYKTKAKMLKAIERHKRDVADAEVVEADE